jgi:molybdopterin/thiamine biosynthesis adenylyltransferase
MRRPRIKPEHNPALLPGGRIRIGSLQYGVGSEIQDDDGTIWRLLGLMDGTRGVDAIVRDILQATPEIDAASIRSGLEVLIAAGFVEDAAAPMPASLTQEEVERYSRGANYFAWIDTQPRSSRYEIQERLKQARVTVVGLGGAGSAMVMSLAATGVGALHCVDFDRVEESNLNRQVLYTEVDIGRPIVERAVAHLRRLNRHITITGQELQIRSSHDLIPLMESCDMFILCADKPPGQIQSWTNEAALCTRTPWLISVYAGPMIVVGIFVPFQTACYACFTHHNEQQRSMRDGDTPVTLMDVQALNAVIAPSAGLTGHFGALEAIYFVAGLQPQTVGRLFHQNLMIYDHFYYITPPFWPECPACGPTSPYR